MKTLKMLLGRLPVVLLLLLFASSASIAQTSARPGIAQGHAPVVSARPALSDLESGLIESAQMGDMALALSLVSRGVDVNCEDELGITPVMYAAKLGDTRMLQLLFDHGADVNHTNNVGATALMLASKYGHSQAVAMLVGEGAEINARTNRGFTAMRFAQGYERQNVVRMLRRFGGLL